MRSIGNYSSLAGISISGTLEPNGLVDKIKAQQMAFKFGGNDDLSKALASAGEAVLAIAVLVAFGVWGGNWLDEKFHTQPLMAVLLALLGMAAGLARMVVKALQAEKQSAKEEKSGNKDQTI